ncbi:MAG: hypothetical protein ACK58L_21845, partial [Planctomycetota bacterium]
MSSSCGPAVERGFGETPTVDSAPGPLTVFSFLRNQRREKKTRGVHLTFAQSRMGQTVSRAGMFLKKQIWIWPIIAVVCLSIIHVGVRKAISATIEDNLSSQMQALLNVEAAMLQTWFEVQESNAQSAANSLRVREMAYQLLQDEHADGSALVKADPDAVASSSSPVVSRGSLAEVHANLRHELSPIMSSHQYIGYILADKDRRICSATSPELLNRVDVPELEGLFVKTLEGETCVAPPFLSVD